MYTITCYRSCKTVPFRDSGLTPHESQLWAWQDVITRAFDDCCVLMAITLVLLVQSMIFWNPQNLYLKHIYTYRDGWMRNRRSWSWTMSWMKWTDHLSSPVVWYGMWRTSVNQYSRVRSIPQRLLLITTSTLGGLSLSLSLSATLNNTHVISFTVDNLSTMDKLGALILSIVERLSTLWGSF